MKWKTNISQLPADRMPTLEDQATIEAQRAIAEQLETLNKTLTETKEQLEAINKSLMVVFLRFSTYAFN